MRSQRVKHDGATELNCIEHLARELRVLNADKIVSSINYVANLDNHLQKYGTGHSIFGIKKNGLKTKCKT